jgi:opacity protein-like surface antigen
MMKLKLTPSLLIAACCSLSTLAAWSDPKDDLAPTVAPPEQTNIPVSQEFTMEGSYTGKSTTKQGSSDIGGVSNINSHFNYVVSPQIQDGFLLRFGVDTERNSFSLPSAAPLPNTLQSVNAIIGADFAYGEKIITRVELHPGIYSDFVNITGNDFDCPVQIGGTYLYSSDLQFILGVQIDLKSNYPIIGLPGVRWQFADKWVLSAIPPKPQLQYELNNATTLYVGAEILGGTYHLNNDFGSNHGHGPNTNNSQLNNNIVDFTEFRVGAGATWKFLPNLSLDVSGGYMPYRDFEMHADKIGFDTHSTEFHNSLGDGAPYAEAGISGSF